MGRYFIFVAQLKIYIDRTIVSVDYNSTTQLLIIDGTNFMNLASDMTVIVNRIECTNVTVTITNLQITCYSQYAPQYISVYYNNKQIATYIDNTNGTDP